MLKVTIVDQPTEQRIVLEGRLMKPAILELKSAWERARRERASRPCVVD